MHASVAVGLALLLQVLLLTTGVQAALSFRLDSVDFPQLPSSTQLMTEFASTQKDGHVCVLVSLDSGLGGVVRFTYNSNVTDVHQRANLLVSFHRPSKSAPSMAALDAASDVVDTKYFSAEELHRHNVEAGVVRRNRERQGKDAPEINEDMARSFVAAMRPVEDGYGPGAKYVDGNYAACFRLMRRTENGKAVEPIVNEEVRIQLLEVASTSHSNSTYIARLSAPAVLKGDVLTEADEEYGKMIRMIFRANPSADLQKLLSNTGVVTSEQMRMELDALMTVQKQLFGMYSTSEHLEERYERMRATAETTFTRIWICMALTVTVMGGTIWYTFYYTKDIIVKRKLI